MYIKSIELDGFKSYAKPVKIEGFHTQFNAITGFNGTGKSNILDSICFLLGITKLENIRAKQMTDLIFKQGQAGINRAVVTIKFDNSDKVTSPLGMQDLSEIVVKRTIAHTAKGTSSSYTFNGQAVINSKVQDFFRAIGLNVNNPHFLIMQGRITKVLNMKSEEILGMIEEAAGTKMYDQKKKDAEKTMLQKDVKLDEITTLLDHNIVPKMAKMKEDRDKLVNIMKQKKYAQQLQRKIIAHNYWSFMNTAGEQKDLIAVTHAKIEDKKKQDENKEETIQKKSAKLKEKKDEFEQFIAVEGDDQLKEVVEKKTKLEIERDACSDTLRKTDLEWKNKLNAQVKDEKAVEKKTKELETIREKHKHFSENDNFDEEIAKLVEDREALSKGLTRNQDGSHVTLEQRIQELKTMLSEVETAFKTATLRKERLVSRKTVLAEKVAKSEKSGEIDQQQLQKLGKEIHSLQQKLDSMNFDEASFDHKMALLKQCETQISEKKRQMHYLIEHECQGRFDFGFNPPKIAGFNADEDVLGTVATLFKIKEPKREFAAALEIGLAGRLTQVVVRTAELARAMVEQKCFGVRRTMLPLDDTKVISAKIPREKINRARVIAQRHNDIIEDPYEMLEYPTWMNDIMINVVGQFLICKSMSCATEIANDPGCRVRTITMRGDDIRPSGIMSGGSNERANTETVDKLSPVYDLRKELKELRDVLPKLQEDVNKLIKVAEEYKRLKEQKQTLTSRYDALKDTIGSSQHGVNKSELEGCNKDIEETDQQLAESKAKLEELKKDLAEKEGEKMEATNNQTSMDNRKDEIRRKIEQLEKARDKNKNSAAAANMEIMSKDAEINEIKAQIEEQKKWFEDKKELMLASKLKVANLEKELEEYVRLEADAKNAIQLRRKDVRKMEDDIGKIEKEIDSLKRDLKRSTDEIENMRKAISEYEEVEKNCLKLAQKEKRANEWIEQDEKMFGEKGSIYDFAEFDKKATVERANAILEQAEQDERRCGSKTDKATFDMAEAKMESIKTKLRSVEADKALLLSTIRQLDQRKVEEIHKAHESVNKDFGNIFSTLLPGAHAQLVAPEDKDILDGLEVKVSFNGQVKDSLQELSGGQRSLVALSLILAMLKFKPAPLYILDEVDAALDLSHTANIGKMIKTHFTNSQFIVVSLKEGMFSNADVLFQTKFVDGSSTVIRTVNNILT